MKGIIIAFKSINNLINPYIMQKKILFILSLILINLSAFSTVFTVTSPGNSFSPSSITITAGDTVIFSIASSHNVVEVSQTTYNSNGNTALSGGFSLPYSGGTLYTAGLTAGTHYYVCSPHASMGMKGIIIVQACNTPAQPAAITGNAGICSATSNSYSIAAVSGATSYTWSLPSGWSGSSTTTTITTVSGTSSGNVSVTANNACGASAAKTFAVTVTPTPAQPAAISGNGSTCNGSSNTYTTAAVAGITSYTWSLPSGWSGTSATSTITAVAGTTGGTISVTASNSCGTSAAKTLAVSVNTIPAQPAAISGSSSVCNGSSNTYSVTAVSGAASYTWTLPSGWSGTSTTATITTTATNAGGIISVKAANSCGSSASQTLTVTSNTVDTSVTRSGAMLTANATAASYQWINCSNNSAISGQTAQSFTPSTSGSYAVIVTKNGCSDTSNCYAVNIVGVAENAAEAAISLYPNPAKGKLFIQSDKHEISTIEFYNLVGERSYHNVLNSFKTEIDLSGMPKGIYFVKITTQHSNYTKRIVVQ
jgi:plastocyanin